MGVEVVEEESGDQAGDGRARGVRRPSGQRLVFQGRPRRALPTHLSLALRVVLLLLLQHNTKFLLLFTNYCTIVKSADNIS